MKQLVINTDGTVSAKTLIPDGGSTGQVLAKSSGSDGDTAWATLINDSGTSDSATWSSSKINTTLGDISTLLTTIIG